MKTVEQTKEMLVNLETKLKQELESLEQGFREKDFTKVNLAARQLNLYAQRGYNLGADNGNARFVRSVRQEFVGMMQADLERSGIDVTVPVDNGGDAIYFNVLGERLAVLYGEFDSVRLHEPFSFHNLEEKIEGKINRIRERQESVNRNIANHEHWIGVIQPLLEKPELIRTESYQKWRQAETSALILGKTDTARMLERNRNKWMGRLYSKYSGKYLLDVLRREDTKKRLEEIVCAETMELEHFTQEREQNAKMISKLTDSKEELMLCTKAFEQILKDYNVPVYSQ